MQGDNRMERCFRERGFIRFPLLLLAACLGVITGLSGYTFFYAQGTSYLRDDPVACKNCHIMREHFDIWARTSHHAAATCNDCHTPDDFFGKYSVKAINGWNHSVAFTTGSFPEPLRIKSFNKAIVQDNCITCHHNIVERMGAGTNGENADCLQCHSYVGHNFKY